MKRTSTRQAARRHSNKLKSYMGYIFHINPLPFINKWVLCKSYNKALATVHKNPHGNQKKSETTKHEPNIYYCTNVIPANTFTLQKYRTLLHLTHFESKIKKKKQKRISQRNICEYINRFAHPPKCYMPCDELYCIIVTIEYSYVKYLPCTPE